MKILIGFAILFVSFLIGASGFPQIVGIIKYHRNFKFISALFTILIWMFILSALAFAIYIWFKKYLYLLVIGYIISFLLSLNTKPD